MLTQVIISIEMSTLTQLTVSKESLLNQMPFDLFLRANI